MKRQFNSATRIFTLLAAILPASYIQAEDAEIIEPVDTTTEVTSTIGTSVNTESKLSQQYAEFLGSEEQAAIVVDGLRQGKSFSYTTENGEIIEPENPIEVENPVTPENATVDNTVTPENPIEVDPSIIEPPTGKMGYGNVKMTLSLAEAKLAEMGITQPTSEQLSAVLLGGEINGQPVDGILAMRAEGMGWGEIAQQYDMKVGQLMGKGHVVTTTPEPTTLPAETTTANSDNGYISPYKGKSHVSSSTTKSNGYISSSKSKSYDSASAKHTNGYISSSGNGAGKGIVTASGSSASQVSYSKSTTKVNNAGGNSANAHAANKVGYIASGSTSSGATSTITTAAAASSSHSSNGKANGHVNKK